MIKNWVVSLVIFSFSIFHNSQYHVAAVAPIKTAMGVPTQFRYILTNHPQGFLQLQPDVKPVTRRFRTANNPSKAIVEPHSTIQEGRCLAIFQMEFTLWCYEVFSKFLVNLVILHRYLFSLGV